MKIYIPKNKTCDYIIEPTPEDLESFYVAEVDRIPKPNEEYNPISGKFEVSVTYEASCIRKQRTKLLEELDKVVSNPLRWNEFSEESQKDLINYRKELLDITDQEGFPFNVTWPDSPFKD